MRKCRFIPRIVLDSVNVLARMLMAHTYWAALARIFLFLALGLGSLMLAIDWLKLPLLGRGELGCTRAGLLHIF